MNPLLFVHNRIEGNLLAGERREAPVRSPKENKMRKTSLLLGVLGALSLSSCNQLGVTKPAPKTYVLVHGALLGEFSWQRVERQLVADGNTVITLDLPGHGADQTPVDQITLDSYTNAVVGAIGDRQNVILVGHSFGGIVISQVAEAIPAKISKLVYLAALVPQNGESANDLAGRDQNSLFGKYATFTSNTIVFNPEGVQPVFCNDCTDADVALLGSRLRPEPLKPFATPVNLTAARYGSVPKYDILTKRDNAVSYPFQQTLQGRLKPVQSFELDAGHVPFLTQPEALTRILEGL